MFKSLKRGLGVLTNGVLVATGEKPRKAPPSETQLRTNIARFLATEELMTEQLMDVIQNAPFSYDQLKFFAEMLDWLKMKGILEPIVIRVIIDAILKGCPINKMPFDFFTETLVELRSVGVLEQNTIRAMLNIVRDQDVSYHAPKTLAAAMKEIRQRGIVYLHADLVRGVVDIKELMLTGSVEEQAIDFICNRTEEYRWYVGLLKRLNSLKILTSEVLAGLKLNWYGLEDLSTVEKRWAIENILLKDLLQVYKQAHKVGLLITPGIIDYIVSSGFVSDSFGSYYFNSDTKRVKYIIDAVKLIKQACKIVDVQLTPEEEIELAGVSAYIVKFGINTWDEHSFARLIKIFHDARVSLITRIPIEFEEVDVTFTRFLRNNIHATISGIRESTIVLDYLEHIVKMWQERSISVSEHLLGATIILFTGRIKEILDRLPEEQRNAFWTSTYLFDENANQLWTLIATRIEFWERRGLNESAILKLIAISQIPGLTPQQRLLQSIKYVTLFLEISHDEGRINDLLGIEYLFNADGRLAEGVGDLLYRIPEHLFPQVIPQLITIGQQRDLDPAQQINQAQIYVGVLVRDRANNPNAEINYAQSVHNKEVEQSVRETALRLKDVYVSVVSECGGVDAVIEEIRHYLEALSPESEELMVARRGFARITGPDYVYNDRETKIATKELLAYVYLAFQDKERRYKEVADADVDRLFVRTLHHIQREYNLREENGRVIDDFKGEDHPSCVGGTFNKLVEYLNSVHPACEIRLSSRRMAEMKLPSIVVEEAKKYLIELKDSGQREELLQSVANDFEKILPLIKDRAIERCVSEFGSVYPRAEITIAVSDASYLALTEKDVAEVKKAVEKRGFYVAPAGPSVAPAGPSVSPDETPLKEWREEDGEAMGKRPKT